MSGSPSLSTWLSQAREILAAAHGLQPGPLRVRIWCPETGASLSLVLPGESANGDGTHAALSPIEESIVAAVSESGPLTAKLLAKRLHVPNDGSFRAILSNLCQRRPAPLISDGTGYRVSDTP